MTTVENGHQTSSIPIGFVIGPLVTGGNIMVAEKANGKFKKELSEYNLIGVTIKKGETKVGLIGISSRDYDAIKLKIVN